MLRAEQAALEQHGKSELLRILDREFEYYKQAYDSIGTQAALIAGFTVTVIVTLDTSNAPHTLPNWVKTMYHIFAFVALMALSYTVLAVTTVVVWGPGLALRGSDPNSMQRAVEGIKAARFEIFPAFFIGVVAFLLMSTTVAWVQMDTIVAGVCSVLAGVTFVGILINGVRTKTHFKVTTNSSGPLTYERVSAASSAAGSANSGHSLLSAGWTTATANEPLLSERQSMSARFSNSNFTSFRRSTGAPVEGGGCGVGGPSHQPQVTPPSPAAPASKPASTTTTTNPAATAAIAPTTSASGCGHSSSGGGGGGVAHALPATGRNSLNRASDELATKLVVEGGGWLWKKDKRYGWKKRWVSLYQDCLFYSKAQQPPRHHVVSSSSSAAAGSLARPDEKRIWLGNMELSVGSDGSTVRLSSSRASSSSTYGGGAENDRSNDGVVKMTSFRGASKDRAPDLVDFRCELTDERGAWVAYLKAGIATGMKTETPPI